MKWSYQSGSKIKKKGEDTTSDTFLRSLKKNATEHQGEPEITAELSDWELTSSGLTHQVAAETNGRSPVVEEQSVDAQIENLESPRLTVSPSANVLMNKKNISYSEHYVIVRRGPVQISQSFFVIFKVFRGFRAPKPYLHLKTESEMFVRLFINK